MAEDEEPDAAAEAAQVPRRPSQAVVVIHGMGEQRPMATIRSFVDAVWTTDPTLTPRHGSSGDERTFRPTRYAFTGRPGCLPSLPGPAPRCSRFPCGVSG